jgi:hypothetical protein
MHRRWGRGGRSREGVAGPHQHFPILVHGESLPVGDLGLQVLKGVIIELELPSERAIGDAASTLDHTQGLVQNFLKGHGRLSTALARAPPHGKRLIGIAFHGQSTVSIPGARGGGRTNSLGRAHQVRRPVEHPR